MAYVKLTGYIEVPDEHLSGDRHMVTADGYEEVQTVRVGDLEDLRVEEDDRG